MTAFKSSVNWCFGTQREPFMPGYISSFFSPPDGGNRGVYRTAVATAAIVAFLERQANSRNSSKSTAIAIVVGAIVGGLFGYSLKGSSSQIPQILDEIAQILKEIDQLIDDLAKQVDGLKVGEIKDTRDWAASYLSDKDSDDSKSKRLKLLNVFKEMLKDQIAGSAVKSDNIKQFWSTSPVTIQNGLLHNIFLAQQTLHKPQLLSDINLLIVELKKQLSDLDVDKINQIRDWAASYPSDKDSDDTESLQMRLLGNLREILNNQLRDTETKSVEIYETWKHPEDEIQEKILEQLEPPSQPLDPHEDSRDAANCGY